MDAPIGTKAQQTALRNIVAMLTIADSGVIVRPTHLAGLCDWCALGRFA